MWLSYLCFNLCSESINKLEGEKYVQVKKWNSNVYVNLKENQAFLQIE